MIENKITTKSQVNNYSMDSIAGYESEKQEALKIINLFRNFDNLKNMGISIQELTIIVTIQHLIIMKKSIMKK